MRISNNATLSLAAIAGLVLTASSLHAATLQVDLGRSDGGGGASGAPQTGWEGWTIAGTQGAMNTSDTFTYAEGTAGTVDITLTSAGDTYARNYGNTITGAQSGFQSLLEDFVFFNEAEGPNFIQVQIDDLKAGSYTFTGYHHFVQDNDKFPTMDILLNGVDTGQDIATELNDSSSSYLIDTFNTSVVNFTVATDNDPVTIRYANPSPIDGTDNDHFALNGFQLDLIPEPSTAVLFGLGGLAALLRRRRN